MDIVEIAHKSIIINISFMTMENITTQNHSNLILFNRIFFNTYLMKNIYKNYDIPLNSMHWVIVDIQMKMTEKC